MVFRFVAVDRTGNDVLIRGTQVNRGTVVRVAECGSINDPTMTGPVCLGTVTQWINDEGPWNGMIVTLDV